MAGVLGDLTQIKPNPGHYALAMLEKIGILKCVITQNIDNLHEQAGSEHVIDYHGNHVKLRCMRCNTRYPTEEYDLLHLKDTGKLPPRCKDCGGVIKPDIVYFQEQIPRDILHKSLEEVTKCDLLLVCGTSAVVYPFADLPRIARDKGNVIIIEINSERTPLTDDKISDYLIQGKTGRILPEMVNEVEKLKL